MNDDLKADEARQRNHDLALMDRVPLCGLSLGPISIRTFVLLKQCGNKFIVGGGVPTPADVAIYLWFHSPDYCLDERIRRKFMRSIRGLLKPKAYAACLVAINQHLAISFMDAPKGLLPNTSTVPGLIDLLAIQYGWTDAAIMDMPIARAFLYRLTIVKRLMAEAKS